MAPVDGFNATVALSEPARASAAVRHRMGLELVDGLAALAAVEPEAAGLSDFGRIDGFLERQVDRWASELAGYARFPEWTGPRSEEHTSELQSLMRISYAVFCLTKKKPHTSR